MSTQVQRRKGTTAQHASFTGASAELTVDTTKNTVVVHDGATAGGIPLAKETGSTISATSLSLPNSTSNGVAYVNGSKVVVAGSVLTFNGSDLSVNGITVGRGAAAVDTNTAIGVLSLGVNVSGGDNTAVGYGAMKGLTTANGNTAVGAVALWSNCGWYNTAIGLGALFPSTGTQNTALGFNAGGSMTSGSKNTIIGSFSGNGGGLDIRTASNYIVLSDGDANPRAWWNGANPTFPGVLTLSDGTANGVPYLNGSKQVTTGSALTFNGTTFGVTGSITASGTLSGTGTNTWTLQSVGASGSLVAGGWLYGGNEGLNLSPNGAGLTKRLTISYFTGAAYSEALGISNVNTGPNTGILSLLNDVALVTSSGLEVKQSQLIGYSSYAGIGTNGLAVAGNVGIGTSSPAALLHLSSGNGTKAIWGTTRSFTVNRNWQVAVDEYAEGKFTITPSTTLGGTTFTTPAICIDSSGNLLVGRTSSIGGARVSAETTTGTPTYAAYLPTTGTETAFLFVNPNGTVGSITTNGSATLYNVTSDQRLKENVQDAASASALIDAIQVRQYDWKSDGSHQRYGFVAQELVAVAPEAVHQPADPEEMMAVDYSKLVPMLVKEIQDLRKRLAALEAA